MWILSIDPVWLSTMVGEKSERALHSVSAEGAARLRMVMDLIAERNDFILRLNDIEMY